MKLTVILCLIAIVNLSVGIDVITYAVEDAYLNSGSPNTNYGAVSTGYCGQETTSPFSYNNVVVKFNISTITNASKIVEAYVHYIQEFVSDTEIIEPTITVDSYEISTNWIESGSGSVTWNNPPTVIKQIRSAYQDGNIDEIIFDATIAVFDAVSNGHQLVGVLGSASSVASIFMDETTTTANKPYMVITLRA